MATRRSIGFLATRKARQAFPVSELSEACEQPDSCSRIGGRRGEDEYGLYGEVVHEGSHAPAHEELEPQVDAEPLETAEEPLPYGELNPGFPGVSEWSAESAGLEEPEEQLLDQPWQFTTVQEAQRRS